MRHGSEQCAERVEWLLTKTIEAGTVMEKNIAHPTDARLYEKARYKLVALADEGGITLRQNYNRLALRLALQIGRLTPMPSISSACARL